MKMGNLRELGPNLRKIIKRLCANQDLCRFLYYKDHDPLSDKKPNVTEKQVWKDEKLIRVVPVIQYEKEERPLLSLQVIKGEPSANNDFLNIFLVIDVFTPLNQWQMVEDNLRPFAIIGEIQKALVGKEVDGLGKLSGGSFALSAITELMSCYTITFSITQFK